LSYTRRRIQSPIPPLLAAIDQKSDR